MRLLLLLAAGLALPAQAQDADAGSKHFVTCAVCHGSKGEGTSLGPPLIGIVGRAAASDPEFVYSAALRRSNIQWTESELIAFLTDPQGRVKGTRMVAPGLPAKAAADVAAYLARLN